MGTVRSQDRKHRRTRRVLSIKPDQTVAEAAAIMCRHKVGCLIVTDGRHRLVGVVTERDVVGKAVAQAMDASKTPVSEVMTSRVATCPPGSSLNTIRRLMVRKRIRHLPITKGGKVVDVVSTRDLMEQEIRNDRHMRAAAEQAAMLSTCLHSLDMDEVVTVILREVPKLFHAGRSALLLPQIRDGRLTYQVSRHKCTCPDREMRGSVPRHTRTQYGLPPEACRRFGARSAAVRIPVQPAHLGRGRSRCKAPGYLCMCGMTRVTVAKELVWYKCALVRNIVASLLTNAKMYQQARRTSMVDPLTGAGTRWLFEERLEAEVDRARRYGQSFSVAIVDLDRFKSINDKLGHAAGDEALRKLASIMRRQKRASDVLARYGGDEFVLLLPQTRLEASIHLLERIRHAVREVPMPKDLLMTISAGVAERSTDGADTGNELVRRADMALYEAKSDGRDCIKTWKQIACRLEDGSFFESERVKGLQTHLAGLSAQSKDLFMQSVWGLIRALEARDPYTRSHSENVMRYSVAIAETMGLSADDIDVIRRAAMVHDVGKIGVPDAILRKPTPLSAEERSIMEQHPLVAVRILGQMKLLEREVVVIRHHHERWDGTGYPGGIAGPTIPLAARIMCVADSFDAITSDRVYHQSRSVRQAVEVLRKESGAQFDPQVVEAMLAWIDKIAADLHKPLGEVEARDLLHAQKTCFAAA